MSTPKQALALHTAGRTTDALIMLINAIGAAPPQSPAVAEHRLLLASMLEGVALSSGNAVVFHVLRELLRDPNVDPQSVARSVFGLLATHGAFTLLEECQRAGTPAVPEALQALFDEPLVRELLRRTIVTDARAERLFAFARRELVSTSWVNEPEPWRRDAMLTIATTAQLGEYAWPTDETLETLAASYLDLIREWLDDPQPSAAAFHAPMILRLCMFRPLSAVPGAERFLALPADIFPEEWRDLLVPLIDAHLRAPHEQRALGDALPTITGSRDTVSAVAHEISEAPPYPRWRVVAKPHVTSVPAFVRALTGTKRVPDTNRVLIAGCGTGQMAAHTALSFPDASILAVDLSRTSLGYAAFKARELGIANVSFAQGDLLHLDALDERFALVFCSGVLHHLADPMAGWQQLVRRLHPAGVMKIALNSTLARQPVHAARAVIAQHPFEATPDGIRASRQALLALPPNHAARTVTESPDFYSVSGCRDLLMHVQERTFTLGEIAQSLDALGLRFLGFQLPPAVRASFAALNPKPSAMLDLEAWARYEEQHPTVFWGMYQFFVAHRSS